MTGLPSPHIATLKRLRDRLSDLSMRNRSLRLVRLPKKRAFDLAWLEEVKVGESARVLERILSGTARSASLLAVGTDDEEAMDLHRGLTYLDREVRLVEAERGVYDLALGFCFLAGTLAEGKYIQAPLFLVPRRLSLATGSGGGTHWALDPIDDPREVNVNRTLLLALQKYANVTLDLESIEDEALELVFGRKRAPDWLTHVAEGASGILHRQGLRALPSVQIWGVPAGTTRVPGPAEDQPVPALPAYRAEEVPSTPPLRFEVRPHAILSRFPLADTALLADYGELIRILEANPRQNLAYSGRLLGASERDRADAAPTKWRASPRWHIEPIDESQEAILAEAIDGRSMAVFGPPGTGKSQLIANLVATALAEDKRVLVVSQKRPALDVVAQRLGSDLRPFAALVHDPVRDREGLCQRLMDAVSPERRYLAPPARGERQRLLDEIRDAETWFEASHRALSDERSGASCFDALSLRLRHPDPPKVLKVTRLPATSADELTRAMPRLVRFVGELREARAPGTWMESRPSWADLGRDEIETLLGEQLPASIEALDGVIRWEQKRAAPIPEFEEAAAHEGAYGGLIAWCKAAEEADDNVWAWLAVLAKRTESGSHAERVRQEFARLREVMRDRDAARGTPIDRGQQGGADGAFAAWEALARRWYRFLDPQWYEACRVVREHLGVAGIDGRDIAAGIDQWRRRATYGRSLSTWDSTPSLVRALNVDVRVVNEQSLQAVESAALAAASMADSWGRLPPPALRLGSIPTAREQAAALRKLARSAAQASGLLKKYEVAERELQAWTGPAASTWLGQARKAADASHLERLVDGEIAGNFERFRSADETIREVATQFPALAELARGLVAGPVADVASEIWSAYAERWLRDAETRIGGANALTTQSPGPGAGILRNVNQREAEQRRARLADAWERLPNTNRAQLVATLRDRTAAVPEPHRAEIRKRAEQRRRRWPIRKMVEELWRKGLSNIVPVWLCSPETVAAVFPLHPGLFDLVIFDEASQCTLPQGLTSAYRGKTCIVAGDEQQLPPSSLFSTTLEDEDEHDDVLDEESLLSRATNATFSMELLWHYRSRYPDLIGYSNRAFYRGNLRVSPVPVPAVAPPAVHWIPLRGVWDKRANHAEAAAAVDLLAAYLKEHPAESIGAITLNRQQSDHVQDLVDARCEADVEFRALWGAAAKHDLDARPFIRNLENVQGDERDVIVLSVGYAADANGRVPLRFGALSVQGGERRLNVAVSRARKKMIVLCSFDPVSQLDVSESTSAGAKALKDFLCQAQGQGGDGAADGDEGCPLLASEAHRTVVDTLVRELSQRGWDCAVGVGASAARIDVAVRSRRDPNRYVLGLLVDGPGAGWAVSAVGREVGRAAFLARSHWRVHFVTARSLVYEREQVVAGIVRKIEEAEAAMGQIPAPPTVDVEFAPPRPAACVESVRNTDSAGSPRAPTSAGRSPSGDGRSGTEPRPRAAAVPGRSTPPAAVSAPMPTGSRGAVTASAPAGPGAAPRVVRPGDWVRYRVVESEEEREAQLAGPGVPPDASPVAEHVPLAQALLGAEVGEVVEMEVGSRVREMEIVEIRPYSARAAVGAAGARA